MVKRVLLALSVPLLAACSAFPFQEAAAPVDLTKDFEAIIAGVSEFNENSASASKAKTFPQYVELSDNNRRILADIRTAVEVYSEHISTYWDDFPKENTYEFPARQTLKDYEVSMKGWLQIQEEDQAYMETCMNDQDTFLDCLMNRFTEIYDRQKNASESLRPVLTKLMKWQEEFRSQG